MTKLAIIGSGGHTRSSTNLLLNYFDGNDIGIYDESFVKDSKQEMVNFIPLIGSIKDIKLNQGVFLSIGDNSLRKKYFLKFKDQIIKDTIFHSNSLQEEDVEFGISNQIFAYSYINSQVRIGSNNIINTNHFYLFQDFLFGTISNGEHANYCCNTKNNSQCRKERFYAVGKYCFNPT